ncbi:MAG: filamentous hemagglutinin N-terminal domain-containing protein [Geitlerinemataceae cyanobacterium]
MNLIKTRLFRKVLLQSSWLILNLAITDRVSAQIIGDFTLPSNSNVESVGNIHRILGGTRSGDNLFHSFEQFSIPTDNLATFENAPEIDNIITRVTGGFISEIDGTIQTQGSANLILLNPNGIILSPNARLEIGGSFLGSTARSIVFADGTEFGTTDVQTTPLLTISVPIGLQFGETESSIRTVGSNLTVQTGKTLALLGGELVLENAHLVAPGGRVELGSVASIDMVKLYSNFNNLRFIFGDELSRGDISIKNSSIDVMTEPLNGDINTIEVGQDNSIIINARNFEMTGGSQLRSGIEPLSSTFLVDAAREVGINLDIFSGDIDTINSFLSNISVEEYWSLFSGVDSVGGTGITTGNIEINAIDNLRVDRSSINSKVGIQSPGDGNNIDLQARTIELHNASLTTQSEGFGNSGSIRLDSEESLLIQSSEIFSEVTNIGRGNSGNIEIRSNGSITSNFSSFQIDSEGRGDLGFISIFSEQGFDVLNSSIGLRVGSFSSISLGSININSNFLIAEESIFFIENAGSAPGLSFSGNPGNINLKIRDHLVLEQSEISNQVFGGIEASTGITIDARSVELNNNSALNIRVIDGKSPVTGSIEIMAPESVSISESQLSTSTTSGSGGDILITTVALQIANNSILDTENVSSFANSFGGSVAVETNTLDMVNGGRILASTSGNGRAGNINLDISDRINIESSNLLANAESESAGRGGNITIGSRISPRRIEIRENARVAVDSDGTGDAGNITIQGDFLLLDRHSQLTAETTTQEGGNITLRTENFQLRNGSNISTTAGKAGAGGNGGNIDIDTTLLVTIPQENSDITANAFEGNGGSINIMTQGIFGTQFRDEETKFSDITASSRFGLDGTVEIEAPDIDPTQGVVALPEAFQPPGISNPCANPEQADQFFNTGRGGLPPNPREALNLGIGAIEQRNSAELPETRVLVEAQGWIIGANGEIILVAEAPTVTPSRSWQSPAGCSLNEP